jgi:hypothetical protein
MFWATKVSRLLRSTLRQHDQTCHMEMRVVELWKPVNLCKSGHMPGSTVYKGILWRGMATGQD